MKRRLRVDGANSGVALSVVVVSVGIGMGAAAAIMLKPSHSATGQEIPTASGFTMSLAAVATSVQISVPDASRHELAQIGQKIGELRQSIFVMLEAPVSKLSPLERAGLIVVDEMLRAGGELHFEPTDLGRYKGNEDYRRVVDRHTKEARSVLLEVGEKLASLLESSEGKRKLAT